METVIGIIFMALLLILGLSVGYIWGRDKGGSEDSPDIERQVISLVEDAIFAQPYENLGPYDSVENGHVFTYTNWWRVTQIREMETGRIVPEEEWPDVIKEAFR